MLTENSDLSQGRSAERPEESDNDVNATRSLAALTHQHSPAVAMVTTFTVAQGDRHFYINENLTPDISTARSYFRLLGEGGGC